MYLWSVRIRDYVLNITQNDRRLALISFQSVLNELIILLDMLIRMAPSGLARYLTEELLSN